MIDVIVIGGGASGLVSAIYAAKNGKRVLVLEKNNSCGKKLLLTGSGKCNYWNSDQDIIHYHSSDIDLVNKILTNNNKEEILKFFDSIGIVPKIRDGYYYPYSNQAVSVQTALVKEAELCGVKFAYNTEVRDIYKEGDIFRIVCNNISYKASKVILATGSCAYPKTGSDGFGYDISSKLGHNVVKPLPALVQLRSNESYLKEWHGIRADVSVSLRENDNIIDTQYGEIQLTDYGVSGICVFCLSGRVARGLFDLKKEEIVINFLYPFNISNSLEFIQFMDDRDKKVSGRSIASLLDGLLNYKLVNLILKISKIDKDSFWNNLSDNDKKVLGNNLTSLGLNITGTNSFENAQTCSGGILLSEINLNTMESLKIPSLYFVGELLDIDGDCGGYNLTVAWITGMIAGIGVSHD